METDGNENVLTNTKLEHGDWNPAENKWTLSILQGEEKRKIICSYVVMAVGAGGQVPKMPEYANRVLKPPFLLYLFDIKLLGLTKMIESIQRRCSAYSELQERLFLERQARYCHWNSKYRPRYCRGYA
jgi:hypothetical protein